MPYTKTFPVFRVRTGSPVLSISSCKRKGVKPGRTMEGYARKNEAKGHARHRPEKDTATPDNVDILEGEKREQEVRP